MLFLTRPGPWPRPSDSFTACTTLFAGCAIPAAHRSRHDSRSTGAAAEAATGNSRWRQSQYTPVAAAPAGLEPCHACCLEACAAYSFRLAALALLLVSKCRFDTKFYACLSRFLDEDACTAQPRPIQVTINMMLNQHDARATCSSSAESDAITANNSITPRAAVLSVWCIVSCL